METTHTDILIVGAGPTGLMAANQLHRFGVDFIIIDSKEGPTLESRAIATTARSLEIYEQMGLTDTILDQSKKILGVHAFSGGKPKATVILGEVGKNLSDFSYLLAFEQSKNETLLTKNLVEQGHAIQWKHEFLELREDPKHDQIHSRIKNLNTDEEYRITSKYIIGCDGARSPIRHQMGFSFEGGTYENRFYVADTRIKWDLSYDKLIVAPGKGNFCAFLPMLGDGERNYRVLGTLPASYSEKEDVTFREIEGVVKSTLQLPVEFEEVNWFSTYKLHHRRVDEFNRGSVFLAGDSAHIHSPAGGQGMNTGLQDAYNLAWKLAFVLKGYAPPELLETYNAERLPFAKWLLGFSDRGFNLMTKRNWFLYLFRKYVALNLVGIVLQSEALRRLAFRTVSQIDYNYRDQKLSMHVNGNFAFKAGDRFPYIKEYGEEASVYKYFRGNTFHFLYVGNDALDGKIKAFVERLCPFPIEFVHLPLTAAWRKKSVTKQLYALVRPDNYLAWVAEDFEENALEKYIYRCF